MSSKAQRPGSENCKPKEQREPLARVGPRGKGGVGCPTKSTLPAKGLLVEVQRKEACGLLTLGLVSFPPCLLPPTFFYSMFIRDSTRCSLSGGELQARPAQVAQNRM